MKHQRLWGENVNPTFWEGTSSERVSVKPLNGDIWYETDTEKLYMGITINGSVTWMPFSEIAGGFTAVTSKLKDTVSKTHAENPNPGLEAQSENVDMNNPQVPNVLGDKESRGASAKNPGNPVASEEANYSLMLGKQWKEVCSRIDIGSFLCGCYIPEKHRWVFGCGHVDTAKVIYTDNLETFTIARSFSNTEQVKAMIYIESTQRVVMGLAKRVDGTYGKPEIWTSDDFCESEFTKRADLSTLGAGTTNTFRINELLELNDGTILAFTSGDAYKIFKSTDHGTTWSPFTKLTGTHQIFAVDYDRDHNVIGMGAIGGNNHGFYYSNDGGKTINAGYITDGGGVPARINQDTVHAVAYDSHTERWYFGTEPEGYLYRVDRDKIGNYGDYSEAKKYRRPGTPPAFWVDTSCCVLKLHYVKDWGRMFAYVCHDEGETPPGVAEYTEVWSWTDGTGGSQAIEWDSYTPRRLITGRRRSSIRELCAHLYADGKFVMGAAEGSTGVRLFVKADHLKPILSFFATDMRPAGTKPNLGKIGYCASRNFDDNHEETVHFSFPLYMFDMSKDIRIRLVYCMMNAWQADHSHQVKIDINYCIVKRDKVLNPGPTAEFTKNITVSDNAKEYEHFDEFSISSGDLEHPSDIVGVKLTRDGDDNDNDTRNGDWCLIAVHLFQDV